MRRHQSTRGLALGGLIFLTLFLLVSCGKGEDEQVLEGDFEIGAPPPPPQVIDDYSSAPIPEVIEPDDDFHKFNKVMGHCRDSMAHKGKFLKFLMMLLAGRQMTNLADESQGEARGFKSGGRGGICMGKLGEGMGRLRHWKNKFRPGALQNWIGHSTDWAMDGVQYPRYWANGQMPNYLGGTGQ